MDIQKTSLSALRCICMPDETAGQIRKRLEQLPKEDFDLIEIGLKSVTEASIKIIRASIHVPLILASRGRKLTEKGVRLYEQAIKNGWDWIDVDMQSSEVLLKPLIKKLHKEKESTTKLILSVHDPILTTSTRMIEEWIEGARILGKNVPTLPKIVTAIVEPRDIFRIQKIALDYSRRHIGIVLHGQGNQSRESRLLQATSGSAIAYLSLRDSLATAKGQWTIKDWNRTIREQSKPSTRNP